MAEFAGEDQPEGTFSAGLEGSGAGLSAAEVEGRSTLARWLVPGTFPAVREQLTEAALGASTPDEVVDAARRLPSGRVFGNIGDIWQARRPRRDSARLSGRDPSGVRP